MKVQTYLFLDGSCEEAIEFYKSTLGAKVTAFMRFKENPEPDQCSPAHAEKVMHASIRVGETEVMMSDGRCEGKRNFQGFALAMSIKEVSEVERIFSLLADGGQIQMPLMQTFWSPMFGMVADRYGVSWMVMAEAAN
ncbi:MAG: VOC family protein [Candidatus Hydrogenedentes bacterium]|nr:VOC family protein [Candidatus Hydrogenedentota bacterium]